MSNRESCIPFPSCSTENNHSPQALVGVAKVHVSAHWGRAVAEGTRPVILGE